VAGERAKHGEAHIQPVHWRYIRGLRVAGGRTYLGRSAAGHGIVTEGEGIGSDRVAEVSKGPNTP
jgi:hypothetical protein